jgi:hypothetical protein
MTRHKPSPAAVMLLMIACGWLAIAMLAIVLAGLGYN